MKPKEKLFLVLIAAVILAIIILIAVWNGERKNQDNDISHPENSSSTDNHTVIVYSDGLFAKESVIDTTVIQDGLKDMGILITEEYYFTEVVNYSNAKKIFNFELGFTESNYVASYDGCVSVGIDFSKIQVQCDEENKIIFVNLPKSSVQSVVIDPDSFVLYSEKTGIANPISPSDFNNSLIELKKTAEEKSIQKGVLERADENAAKLIENFIGGITDASEYTFQFNKH